ncbi:otolith matrix protein OMM-64-like [Nilaparvata lugens]|uniref:otolith matrix protein OMM-64-like n=1 Tax=Nilaparvata lugens TaxID=108931 RepID=UPI00193DE16B|nr:otolith matrix protein OMM-64-like [Nilaparvata lugens]
MLPSSRGSMDVEGTGNEAAAETMDATFKNYMEKLRTSDAPTTKKKRVKVAVQPGKSIDVADFQPEIPAGDDNSSAGRENSRKGQKKGRKHDEQSESSTEETSTEETSTEETEPAMDEIELLETLMGSDLSELSDFDDSDRDPDYVTVFESESSDDNEVPNIQNRDRVTNQPHESENEDSNDRPNVQDQASDDGDDIGAITWGPDDSNRNDFPYNKDNIDVRINPDLYDTLSEDLEDLQEENAKPTAETKKKEWKAEDFTIDNFVIVVYNGQKYPGKIVKILDNGPVVECMEKKLKFWRWPEKQDCMEYDWDDICEKINPPKVASKRNQFAVPELDNFVK